MAMHGPDCILLHPDQSVMLSSVGVSQNTMHGLAVSARSMPGRPKGLLLFFLPGGLPSSPTGFLASSLIVFTSYTEATFPPF